MGATNIVGVTSVGDIAGTAHAVIGRVAACRTTHGAAGAIAGARWCITFTEICFTLKVVGAVFARGQMTIAAAIATEHAARIVGVVSPVSYRAFADTIAVAVKVA